MWNFGFEKPIETKEDEVSEEAKANEKKADDGGVMLMGTTLTALAATLLMFW